MDDYQHLCPVCKENGHANFLQLRQINLETAVYLCSDIRCTYPLGHSWVYVEKKLLDDDDSDSYSDISDELNNELEQMGISLSQSTIPESQDAVTNNLISNFNSDLGIKDKKVESKEKIGVKKLETLKEINNVIIDNSDNLFNTLTLPTSTELKPTVLAVGSNDTDTVYLNNDIETSNAFQFDVVQEEPYKFKFDIKVEKLPTENTNSNNDESIVTPDESNNSNDFPIYDFNDPVQTFKIQTSREFKFRRKVAKEPKTCAFSDDVVKQALFMKVDEPKHKPTLVEQIKGKMNNGILKNTADKFEGFKFKTEIIKEPKPNVSITESIKDKMPARRKKQTEAKNLLEPVKRLTRISKKKEKSKDVPKPESEPNRNCKTEFPVTIKKESPNNSSPSKDSHGGEHSLLNEWLDNLGDENITTAKVDPEFDAWLSSF